MTKQALERVKVEYVCADCGGRKVRRYGVMGWSVERQALGRCEPLIVKLLDTPRSRSARIAAAIAFAENLGQRAEGLLHNPVPSPLPLSMPKPTPSKCHLRCEGPGRSGLRCRARGELSIAMLRRRTPPDPAQVE